MPAANLFASPAGESISSSVEAATAHEYLEVSGSGAYSASTLCGCNTRKYHGILVATLPHLQNESHVLLSSLDEKVMSEGTAWRLATHRYTGVYYPEGYRYIRNFSASPFPCWTYSMANTLLQKELLFIHGRSTVLIRYTLLTAPAAITLFLMPMLACRNFHTLTAYNAQTDHHFNRLANGVEIKLYKDYVPLYLQLTAPAHYRHTPDWYYYFEYPEEQRRGYDFHEDLYTPGYFELTLLPGQSVVFAAGLEPLCTDTFDALFSELAAEKEQPKSMEDHLRKAAGQFIIHNPGTAYIKAGYYWFECWGRDSCIALPGLTLLTGNAGSFIMIVDELLRGLKDGLLANYGYGGHAARNTADASLWLLWAIQQYVYQGYGAAAAMWAKYKQAFQHILEHYRSGTHYGIQMDADGLLEAGADGMALTWMDAIVDGIPVTPRHGKAVELNALWCNGICFCLELAHAAADPSFEREWAAYPKQIAAAFVNCFWDAGKQYLADCVHAGKKDWSVRPNQLLAVSLPYSPLNAAMQHGVMDKIVSELMTSRGLRTLSPASSHYCGHYGSNQLTRDRSYHQGTVWPWLLGHFADGCLKVYKQAALSMLETLYAGMEPVLQEGCLYTIPEVFDGEYPHKDGGAVAQAWSVAELIRMKNIIDTYKTQPTGAALLSL
ncbi:MAG TPA: amylo-alpha-1,6-glucosidase [Chitinophaga sp.]|uniref:amylo-alpha-1,6-glucosidase n=1 Tax=Chitinophaga sp. TaxID=1869181 RepID=UPI002DBB1EB0|nr:amylo-alpha-1,6-glucosidase [Chitinophaga sp.]HEU4556154.1 amylo-alpha-1,6-glucosidase [Chitinophaga sp.]